MMGHFATAAKWVQGNDETLRRAAYPLVIAALTVSVAFAFVYVISNWPDFRQIAWHTVLLAAAIYLLSHLTTALSWPIIVKGLGKPILFGTGMLIGMVAQIGKYLPGNAAHYFGRAVLARRAGISYSTSWLATAIELIAVAFAAALVGAAALLLGPTIPRQVYIVLALIVGAALALAVWSRRTGHKAHLFAISSLLLAISLGLSGFSFYLFVGNLWAVPAFALAWLIGFLLPGAPAGLGVREAALVALLSGTANSETIAFAIVLHRLLSTACDGGVAAIAYGAFLVKIKKSANDVVSLAPGSNG